MPRWPIRLKLIVGLSLVVGMMLMLMGASIFGLHSFHTSYLTLVDQLRELGASADLLESVFRLAAPRDGDREGDRRAGSGQVLEAQQALAGLLPRAEEEHDAGEPADNGRDELGLAFLIDTT